MNYIGISHFNHFNNNILFSWIAIFLLLLHACSPSAPHTEERIERFETGVISRQYNLIDGKREGKMTDFYPDGKLMAERWFVNGQQEGKTLIYYPSGNIKEVQYYTHGLQSGGDTIWYENGKLQFTVIFKENKKDGYLRKWSPDGAIIFESKFAMDTLVEVKGQAISRQTIIDRTVSDTVIRPKSQKK